MLLIFISGKDAGVKTPKFLLKFNKIEEKIKS